MSEAAAVADRIETMLAPLHKGYSLAWWDLNVEASEEHERSRVESDLALSDLLADPGLFAEIEAARPASSGIARRRLDLLYDTFLPRQVPGELRTRLIELGASVEARYSSHRAVVGGNGVDDNEIKRILRTSDEEGERREAWEASKTVGAAVADDVRELARLRNEIARRLGFRDWFALSLATSEMSETLLFRTLEEADSVTAEPFARWKSTLDGRLASRFGCEQGELRPWHYADPFFQEVPAEGGVDLGDHFHGRDLVGLAVRTYDGLGLETRSILERSDLYPRAGKSQHAFCIDVDRAGDIRVLANIVADQYWLETMLHELGHGVFDAGLDAKLPWLLRDVHLVTTEGIAILMGRLVGEAEWLERVAGIDAGEAAVLQGSLRSARAAELLLFTRWVLVMTNFERALYDDPDSDLDTRWWELVHRFQLITPPEGRRAPDWAAKIHVAVAPVYYHTYLYGQMVASQLAETLRRECGGLVDREAAGRLLSERVFAPGLSVRWDALLEQATGEPLTAAEFGRDLEV